MGCCRLCCHSRRFPDKRFWIAEQLDGGGFVGKLGLQESFVRGVLEQSPDEIRHAGQQFADRAIFPHAITHLDQRALDRAGHSVKQLKLEAALVDSELLRVSLRVRDAANVVRPESGRDDGFVVEQDAGALFETGVALRLLQKDGAAPAVLRRFDLFVIPVGALDQADGEARAARAAPIEQLTQIALGVAQVGLDDDAGVRPIAEFRFGEKRSEKFERGIFVRVTLHVEIHERADLARAPQDRAQLRGEVGDRVLRVGRIHLRIERGDFDRNVHDREQLGILSERIGPAAGLFRQPIEQREAARGIFVRFLFAHDRFAEEIDGEPDPLLPPLPQHFHDVVRISSGDELPRHAGNVPAQNRGGEPGEDPGGAQTGLEERHEAVAHVREIFVEVLDDVARAPERREHIDEAEHLHLEMLVPHRERHHPLVKAGLGENRFGIPVDQLENSFASLLDLALQRTHGAILTPPLRFGKASV